MQTALKEWSIAVEALTHGETIALLRKGGIRESGRNFEVKSDRVLLYPTYEHQKPELLEPPYSTQVRPVESGWHPETVTLKSWAHVTHILPLRDPEAAFNLLGELVWNRDFVRDRVQWKPDRPLFVLLLRTYRLAETVTIPYLPQYGGCRSWIDLAEDIPTSDRHPVLDDVAYGDRVRHIEAQINQPVSQT